MNQYPGVIGRKLGSTQIFMPNGDLVACAVIEAGPNVVVGHRTVEKDGYVALVLGFGKRKAQRTTKPLAGQFKKIGVEPMQHVREFRVPATVLEAHPVGSTVKLDAIFTEGQIVDVKGKTRGRGFTGVVRRWAFAGFVQTHGTHEYRRHGGSIGTNMTPGRTLANIKMPGHYGNEELTVLNQRIVKIDLEKNLILVDGGVPGARNSIVSVRGAIKRSGGSGKTKKKA